MMGNLFWALLVVLPAVVSGDCTCEPEDDDRNKSLSLKYKGAAIASILVASAIGVMLPSAGKRFPALSPERGFFFIVKAFAAGVILSTGFIHVLPDAFESLKSPCLPKKPWGDFPFTGFVAMLSAIGTLMVDTYATSYYGRRSRVKAEAKEVSDVETAVPAHTHATHGHAHGSVSLSGETELLRHRVISQVLFKLENSHTREILTPFFHMKIFTTSFFISLTDTVYFKLLILIIFTDLYKILLFFIYKYTQFN